MANYEIMLILDPKEDLKVAQDIVNDVFTNAKFTKLDRTELAYEINKSKSAIYALVETEATGEDIKEFTRKVNITKTVWRNLVINLDSERGRASQLKRDAEKPARSERPRFERSSRYDRSSRPARPVNREKEVR